jgi:hypothetical protein
LMMPSAGITKASLIRNGLKEILKKKKKINNSRDA